MAKFEITGDSMPLNIDEAVQRIKKVGAHHVRIIPMPGQSVVDGKHQIELNEGGNWSTIVTGINKKMAENIVEQATNRVILD